MYPDSLFTRFAKWTSRATGHPATFATAVLVILGWAVLGPVFGFSDTWQLVINTGTTIVTFLMVFLIQNTQNRDSEAIQIKLDEIRREYTQLAERARQALRQGIKDTDCPEFTHQQGGRRGRARRKR